MIVDIAFAAAATLEYEHDKRQPERRNDWRPAMSRISLETLTDVTQTMLPMRMDQKELLADELFYTQPNLFGSALTLEHMGVSLVEVVLDLLLICFQSMKLSGLPWSLISEADLD